MKKRYIIPETNVVRMYGETILSVSGVISNNGIDYGGVDEEGELDPEVKGNPFGDSIFD